MSGKIIPLRPGQEENPIVNVVRINVYKETIRKRIATTEFIEAGIAASLTDDPNQLLYQTIKPENAEWFYRRLVEILCGRPDMEMLGISQPEIDVGEYLKEIVGYEHGFEGRRTRQDDLNLKYPDGWILIIVNVIIPNIPNSTAQNIFFDSGYTVFVGPANSNEVILADSPAEQPSN